MLIYIYQRLLRGVSLGIKASHTALLFSYTEYHQEYAKSHNAATATKTNEEYLP